MSTGPRALVRLSRSLESPSAGGSDGSYGIRISGGCYVNCANPVFDPAQTSFRICGCGGASEMSLVVDTLYLVHSLFNPCTSTSPQISSML
jgi:hypothetical protein